MTGEEAGLFVVVEVNQASGQPERLVDDVIATTLDEARESLAFEQAHVAETGRRERFRIARLEPVDGEERET